MNEEQLIQNGYYDDPPDIELFKQDFISELHRLTGKCGCCGTFDCEGKQSHSILPKKIDSGTVLDVFHRMIKIHLIGRGG